MRLVLSGGPAAPLMRIHQTLEDMKSDYIYFGDSGLTSTSANHVANMAKESIRNIMGELSSISFFGATVSLLSGGTPLQAKIGSSRDDLDKIQASLETVGEAHALCAWLREAIKAKTRLLAEVKSMSLSDYCKDVLGGVEVPEYDTNIMSWMKERGYKQPDINGDFPDVPDPGLRVCANRIEKMCKQFGLTMPVNPVPEQPMTEDDYMATLSVKDRNRILMLEAKAAAIGKYVHEDGTLSNERERLRNILANPIKTDGDGANTRIYRFEPAFDNVSDVVDGLFFRLSAEHRATQAELNGLLAERDRTIEADKQEKAARYQKASNDFSREMSVLQDKLNAYMLEERKKMSALQDEYGAWSSEQKNRHARLTADFAVWKLAESERIAGLGIIIPNELRGIYERVNGLGK